MGTHGEKGTRFFTMMGGNDLPIDSETFLNGATTSSAIMARYKNITAKNFSISKDITDSISAIATTDKEGEINNINTLKSLLNMRANDSMFAEGAPEDFMKSLVATLGIDSQQAKMYNENQTAIVSQIVGRRTSESGVSLNEEMTNMVRFQQAYRASAKMIQTMSEVYNTLINKLGLS